MTAFFGFAHVFVPAVADIAANEPGLFPDGKSIDEFPESRHAVAPGMTIARLHVHAERDANRPDEIRMEVVTRTSRLLRIVAEFSALLMSIDRFDGIVDVDYVRVTQ